jgi:hypothetical protein
MACFVNTSDPMRALAVIDALHEIMRHIMGEDYTLKPGDDFFLRPYAISNIVKTSREDAPCPFLHESVLVFTAYKIRTPHRLAAKVVQLLAKDSVVFLEHLQSPILRRQWRGRLQPKTKLFKNAWDGPDSKNDGYFLALDAVSPPGVPRAEDWEARRLDAKNAILEAFDYRLKAILRGWLKSAAA